MTDCPFCQMKDTIFENELAQAFYDAYPVSEGHMLITPKRHVSSYFEMTKAERKAIEELLDLSKDDLTDKFHAEAYNIGINVGKAAGQTVFHCHVHLIPRHQGDVKNPTGGVRGVIPEKQNYR
ncbi:HIT family protein [Lactococcus lactis]